MQSPASTAVTEFTDIKFTCIVSGYDRPTINWFFNNIQLSNSTTVSISYTNEGNTVLNSILTESNVTRAQDGLYKCIGTNNLNNVSGEFNLTVNCKYIHCLC